MKDQYPASTTLNGNHLVSPEFQPNYADFDSLDVPDTANVGVYLTDRQVADGFGGDCALIDASTGTVTTFAQLAARSNQIAAALTGLGVKSGDRVAYRSPNVSDVIAVMAGIWKVGGVVVPVPLHATANDVRFYLEDTGAKFLLAHVRSELSAQIMSVCDGTSVEEILLFGGNGAGLEAGSECRHLEQLPGYETETQVPAHVERNAVAIIWHTGGTTGMPKGCYHTHRRFLIAGYAIAAQTAILPGERWAAAAPIGHALGIIYNTIFTLLHGATAVLIESYTDARTIIWAVADHRINTLTALSPTWAKMLSALDGDAELPRPRFKRAFAMWQSASSSEVYNRWRSLGVELLNNFGSTSFATWVLAPRYATSSPRAALGQPLPGYSVEAVEVDEHTVRVLPRGEIGQMGVRGPTGLTYWNRHDLQKRDVVDGWTLQDDLIRCDAEGHIHYLGRTDYLISTGGYKVAPAEVEAALAMHGDVREVAVVPGPCPTNYQMVVAYVVLRPLAIGTQALAKDLREFVKGALVSYKAPRRIEFVESLPRDTVGKVKSEIVKQWAYGRSDG